MFVCVYIYRVFGMCVCVCMDGWMDECKHACMSVRV